MFIHNTLTREKEAFKPLRQEITKVYFCGPTPYNYAHIGNLRTYLFEDFVVRTMRYLGYKVETTMNITDIDDKTIRDAQKNDETLQSLTERYTKCFFEDTDALSIIRADHVAPISTLIEDMVTIINGLFEKGHAYLAEDGSVYFAISKFPTYGELAHLDMEGMKTSVRVNNDEYEKDQAADFALWKAHDAEKDGDNVWEAKFVIDGKETIVKGRPGWHIECSACNYHFFGAQIDLHMGGVDNIFPHHQNEIAQTEAFTGKTFAKYWMHSGHLLVDNKKMAKSAGNFYTLRDVIAQFPNEKPETVCRAFRLMGLQTKYRENFNFTFERLESCIATLRGMDNTVKMLNAYQGDEGKMRREIREELQTYVAEYIAALEDDISTPEALAVVFLFFKFINVGIADNTFNASEKRSLIDALDTFNQVLAIIELGMADEAIPETVLQLAADRALAKTEKRFADSDTIRANIESLGYKVVDSKDGYRVEKA